MGNVKTRSKESGVALLMAIFTLMLLAAFGLALLCAADMETNIAANYRDKQVSIYAALSGLQEARDRLIPSRCDTAVGTICNDPIAIDTRSLQVPTLGTPNVIYIINPANGETVAPWDPHNAYFDTELCHENILGLTSTPGCDPTKSTSVVSGTGWYKTYDDSATSAGEFHAASAAFPKPLPYKWVRITLKTDNMTPVNVQSLPTGSTVCWDGKHQIPSTSGYNTDCTAASGIQLFNGTNLCTACTFNPGLGSGYSNPTVTISSGGGAGATATAHVVSTANGQVSMVTVNNGGSNYTSAPTVIFSGGGGTGATAIATLQPAGAPVASFSAVGPTTGCYATQSASVGIGPGGVTQASATAVMTGKTCVAQWTPSGSCSAQGKNTITVSAVNGGGSNFQGSITFKNNGSISSSVLTNPGTGYSSAPTQVSGSGCTLTVTGTLGYHVQSVALASGGSGYISAPTVTIAAPTAPSPFVPPNVTAILGSQPLNVGQVLTVTMTSGGSGYTSPPTVSFSGANGTGAIATASLGFTGKIDKITLTNAGSGYTSNPTVTISDSSGTGASIQARASNQTALGRVFLLTALAVTPGGSRTMSQMEVATPVRGSGAITIPGALTIDAPSPTINSANSNNYVIAGNDADSCGGTAKATKASIGVYDDPNHPTTPSAVSIVTSSLAKPSHYTGSNPAPDVENVYNSLGALKTVAGADALAVAIAADATNVYSSNPGNFNLGTPNSNPMVCPTSVVNGDLTLGSVSGCGVLLVTGNLSMQGNYSWKGPIFVIGSGGSFSGGGGGNGQIIGTLFVAQTKNADGSMRATLGTPSVSFDISGGGGNGIQYDSCFSDNMLLGVNILPPPSNNPLKVLSMRNIF